MLLSLNIHSGYKGARKSKIALSGVTGHHSSDRNSRNGIFRLSYFTMKFCTVTYCYKRKASVKA